MTAREPTRPPASTEIQFSPGKTLAYSVVAVLLGLAAIEVICAVILATIVPDRFEDHEDVAIVFDMVNYPDIVETDPWLFWRLKANTTAPLDQGKMTGFIANGDHMRNPEVPVERGPNDFRVLCLGDSITFGWGVRYEEAYPTLLAGLLRESLPGREVHVLNAACSGYSAHQGAEMLRRRGLAYRPDVVTIWFGWNDSAVWDGMTDSEHARLFAREHLLSRSATYRALSHALRRASHREVRRERKRAEERRPRMPVADYQARLREMVELARGSESGPGRSARVVLIQGCYQPQIRSAHRHRGRFELDDYQTAMAEVAEQMEVPMLSVCDALYRAGVRKKDFLDWGHLDPVGLRVVAEELFSVLAERGMLPDPVAAHPARATR